MVVSSGITCNLQVRCYDDCMSELERFFELMAMNYLIEVKAKE